MKIDNSKDTFINSDQALSGVGFKIKASGKAFRAVIDTLYRYKEEAVVRETVSNADDAHRMRDAGKRSQAPSHYTSVYANALCESVQSGWEAPLNAPYLIHTPTSNEPYFEVVDFGTGLPLSKIIGDPVVVKETRPVEVDGHIVEVPTGREEYQFSPEGKVMYTGGMYTTIFDSPKDQDNNQIGGFGLGCKSPSAVSDSYQVETRYNGEKHILFMYEDKSGMPHADLVTSDERGFPAPIPMVEGEYNGMTVRVPVESSRIEKFNRAISKVMRFMEKPFAFSGQRVTINRPNWLYEFGSLKVTGEGSGRHYAVQGGVCYPIEVEMLSENVQMQMANFKTDTYTFFNIGEVAMQPSREDLEYNDPTIEKLEETFLDNLDKMRGFLGSNVRVSSNANIVTRMSIYDKLSSVFRGSLLRSMLPKSLLFPRNNSIDSYKIIDTGDEKAKLQFGASWSLHFNLINCSHEASLGDNIEHSILPKHLYPVEHENVVYPQTIFIFDGVGYLQKFAAYHDALRGKTPVELKERVYATPCATTTSLMEHVWGLLGLSKEAVAEDFSEAIKTKTPRSWYNRKLIALLNNPANAVAITRDMNELVVKEYRAAKADEYKQKLKEVVREGFKQYEVNVVFASDLPKPKAEVKKSWASGVTALRKQFASNVHHKDFEELVNRARGEDKKIPYVLLCRDVVEDGLLLAAKARGLPFNPSREGVFTDFHALNDFIEETDASPHYVSDEIYGIRKGGLPLLKNFPDVFEHYTESRPKIIDVVYSEETLAIVRENLIEHTKRCIDTDGDHKYKLDKLGKLIPGLSDESKYLKQLFKKKPYNRNLMEDYEKLPKDAKDLFNNDPYMERVHKKVLQIEKFWDEKLDYWEKTTQHYTSYKLSGQNCCGDYAIERVCKELELERVYALAGLQRGSVSQELCYNYHKNELESKTLTRLVDEVHDLDIKCKSGLNWLSSGCNILTYHTKHDLLVVVSKGEVNADALKDFLLEGIARYKSDGDFQFDEFEGIINKVVEPEPLQDPETEDEI